VIVTDERVLGAVGVGDGSVGIVRTKSVAVV